jgi:hypothetical protein
MLSHPRNKAIVSTTVELFDTNSHDFVLFFFWESSTHFHPQVKEKGFLMSLVFQHSGVTALLSFCTPRMQRQKSR